MFILRFILFAMFLVGCGVLQLGSREDEDLCGKYELEEDEYRSQIVNHDHICNRDSDCALLYISNCGSPEYSKLVVGEDLLEKYFQAKNQASQSCPKPEGPTATCTAVPHTQALCSDSGRCYGAYEEM